MRRTTPSPARGCIDFFDVVEAVEPAQTSAARARGHRRVLRCCVGSSGRRTWIASVIARHRGVAWPAAKESVARPRPDVAGPDRRLGRSRPGTRRRSPPWPGVLIVLDGAAGTTPAVASALLAVWVLWRCRRPRPGAARRRTIRATCVAGWLLGALIAFVVSAAFGVVDNTPRSDRPADRPLSSMPEDFRTLAVVLNPIKVPDPDAFKTRLGTAARAARLGRAAVVRDHRRRRRRLDGAGRRRRPAPTSWWRPAATAPCASSAPRWPAPGSRSGSCRSAPATCWRATSASRSRGDEALDTVLRGQDRAIDVVAIEGDNLDPTRFVVMAGLGLDAAIMAGAPDALKARIGWTAYVVAGARHLRYPAVRVDISVDGAEPVRRRARTVVIGNVGSLQAGIPLLPDALIDDGLIDVVVIAPRRLFGWVAAGAADLLARQAGRRATRPVHRQVRRPHHAERDAASARRRHRRSRQGAARLDRARLAPRARPPVMDAPPTPGDRACRDTGFRGAQPPKAPNHRCVLTTVSTDPT